MSKQFKVIFLNLFFFISVILSAGFSANGQINPLDDANWMNIPSSPLKIGIKKSKYPLMNGYFLENTSQGSIISFQLGCVTEENGLMTIHQELEVLKGKVKSVSARDNTFYLPRSPHGSYLSSRCDYRYKVTVINVGFADGGVWAIKK
jgi:hypothetical protein